MTTTLTDLDAMSGTLGEAFAYQYRQRARDARVSTPPGETRTLVASSGGWVSRDDPTVPPVQRPARFLGDVIPRIPTTQGLIPYAAEVSTASNQAAASAVAEGGTKPEVAIQFQGSEVNVRKVDAWLPATSEVLDDAEGLRAYIDLRLMTMVANREDAQVIAGTGTGPDMLGILNTSGVQSQAFTTNVLTTLANALAKVETAAGGGAALAMNPADYWALLAANPTATAIDAAAGTVWGVPVVRTLGCPSGKALAGAFDTAAVIRDRGTNVRITDSHDDYFVKNKTVILAERRSVVCVLAPALFVSAVLS